MTLWVRGQRLSKEFCCLTTSYVRDQTAQQPAESQGPACGDISPQLSPVQYSFRIRVSASDKGGEDDQNNGYAIVGQL